MTQKQRRIAWNRYSNVTGVLRSGILDRICGRNFDTCSDRDLKDTLDGLRQRAQHDATRELLPAVFALLEEAINRRLGAWRIFGSSVNDPELGKYQSIASQVLQSGDYKTRVSRRIEESFLEGETFQDGLTDSLARWNLDDDEETIVKTIVYVTEKCKTSYPWNVPLSAKFYRALARKDPSGLMAFYVTDEQLLAGVILYQGNVVELSSGEGKTIAAAFPAVLHALSGNPVHIVTANDYLAARDSELLAPVYGSLGITVDVVLSYLGDEERRDAYTKQIVYGTLREFGFDFLRDNLRTSSEGRVQPDLGVAIVDEVDNALIDEASIPMIIGGSPKSARRAFAKVRNTVEELIDRQTKVAHSLEKRLASGNHDCAELQILRAKLLLAQPDNSELLQELADNPRYYKRARALIDRDSWNDPDSVLTAGLLYAIDPEDRYVTLTDEGQEFFESRLGPFFDAEPIEREFASVNGSRRMSLAERRNAGAKLARQLSKQYGLGNQVHQMLRAYLLFEKDVDYLVTEDSVVLIDGCTGRPRPDSRYQQGLQEALEAKEHVSVHPEAETLAQISVQGFMSQYQKVSGMTGTALSSRDEFLDMYGLDVKVVQPHRQPVRVDLGSRIYATRQEKLHAVADEVKFCQQVGRPVLVATLTVEQSAEVSSLLTRLGVPHNLLNAVTCHDEARIVKEAGSAGAVTVATNMAGRGTDIVLEPNLNRLIACRYRKQVSGLLSQGSSCVTLNCYTKEEADTLWEELSGCGLFSLERVKCKDLEKLLVVSRNMKRTDGEPITLDFGLGFYVIATELCQSARIELQLRGRSGRQGEFGAFRSFLSLEDQLLVYRVAETMSPSACKKTDSSGRTYFEGKDVDRRVEWTQEIVEREAEAQRRLIRDYSSVLDAQTNLYYGTRRDIVGSSSFRDLYLDLVRQKARDVIDQYSTGDNLGVYSTRFDNMVEELEEDYLIDCSCLKGYNPDRMIGEIKDLLLTRLEQSEARFGDWGFAELAKLLFLQTSDELWKDYFSGLQELMSSVLQGTHSHQSAVAEYVLLAFREWRSFRKRLVSEFLSRLTSFPVDEIAAEPHGEGHLSERDLAHDAAMVLI